MKLKKKHKVYIGVAAAVLLGVLAFALSPVASDAFAGFNASCRVVVEGNPFAGGAYMRCRKATVIYNEDVCTGKCAFIPNIAADAQAALDKSYSKYDVVSEVYVRTLDAEKKPIDKWYGVCFDENAYDDVKDPAIWSYHPQNGWTVLSKYVNEADQLCAYQYGEASLVLIGMPK